MEIELSQDDQVAIGWALAARSPRAQVLAERWQKGERELTREDLDGIRQEWEAAGRPVHERHVHRTRVVLADGTPVTAVSFLAGDPYGRDALPSFGLYLDGRWNPPWPHEHVDWPDFGVPDPDRLRSALEALLARARAGEAVEVGCIGGHGRTGTALACLAVMTGTAAAQAVEWVRAAYCPDAVETDEQRAFFERSA